MQETERNRKAFIGVRQYWEVKERDNYRKNILKQRGFRECRKLQKIKGQPHVSDNIESYRKETTTRKSLKKIQVSDNVGNYKKSKGNHMCPTILEAIGNREL